MTEEKSVAQEPAEGTEQTTLKPAQQRRVLALKAAREVLAGSNSLFGSTGAVESSELVRVADYIINGEGADW